MRRKIDRIVANQKLGACEVAFVERYIGIECFTGGPKVGTNTLEDTFPGIFIFVP